MNLSETQERHRKEAKYTPPDLRCGTGRTWGLRQSGIQANLYAFSIVNVLFSTFVTRSIPMGLWSRSPQLLYLIDTTP